MSKDTFKKELEKTGLNITPGALEVLKNSHISVTELKKTLTHIKRNKSKVITVRKAIDMILDIKESKYKELGIISELKHRSTVNNLSKPLQKTFYTLIRLGKASLPGHVSKITHRRKKTEKRYLSILSELGLVQRVEKGEKIYFIIQKEDS
ncbi:MAG: hypothetical protein ACTSW1_17505 [Candidatus Hodarchaeales archaeon]